LNAVNEALKKSEEHYRIVFTQSPIAIELYNPEGLLVNVNPACLELFGIVDASEISQFSLFDDPNVSDEYKKELRRGKYIRYQAAFNFDKVKELNLYHTTKSGQVWLDVIITPITDDDITINGYLLQIQDITGHKQIERMLETKAREWQETFDAIPDLVSIQDKNHRIIRVNKAYAATFNRQPAELVGKYCYETVHQTSEPMAGCPQCRVMETGKPYSAEFYEPNLSLHLEVTCAPTLNEKNEVVGVVHYTKNITIRKQTEEALKASEINFRNSMDQSPLGKRILNTEGKTIYANQAFLDIYGYANIDEFNSIPAKERYTPQSYSEYVQRKEKRERGEHVTPNYELSIMRKNGEVRHLQVIRKEIFWNNQQEYQVIYQDITERKKNQAALEESEQRYHSLFENMIDGYAYCQMFYENQIPKDFLYLDVNAAFERLTGLRDVAGKMVSQVIPGIRTSNPELFEVYGRVALTGQSEKFETYLELLDIWLSVSVYSPSKGRFVAVFENITDRKKSDLQIKSSLAEKELLLKEIHHRVKNNMQVISSLLKLQSGFLKDKDDLHMFQESQQRIRSMALVYNKLYQSSNLAYINFAEYIRELATNLIHSYNLSTERITTHIEARDVELGLDLAIPCGLIINEAITNSLKYAFPQGQNGEIWVNIWQNDGLIEMSLGDNGIGFPQDIDLSNTNTLGLELIHTLVVHQLGGKIELKRGHGTEYSIRFPKAQKE
jgi:PAS domain S-box-containing protein